jgi:hypothetical protein
LGGWGGFFNVSEGDSNVERRALAIYGEIPLSDSKQWDPRVFMLPVVPTLYRQRGSLFKFSSTYVKETLGPRCFTLYKRFTLELRVNTVGYEICIGRQQMKGI